jgi:hypothetical protein
LRTINDIAENIFAEPARVHRLILDRQHEASMAMLLAQDLPRPSSDLRFIFAWGIESGAGYQMLFDEFQDAMRDDGDIDDSISQKIETIAVRMRSNMQDLDIEEIDSITIDDDRSLSLDALAPEQVALPREIIDAFQYNTKKVMILQGSTVTGKQHILRIILSELHRLRIHYLVSTIIGIAAVQYPGGKLFMLGFVSGSINGKTYILSHMSVSILRLTLLSDQPV